MTSARGSMRLGSADKHNTVLSWSVDGQNFISRRIGGKSLPVLSLSWDLHWKNWIGSSREPHSQARPTLLRDPIGQAWNAMHGMACASGCLGPAPKPADGAILWGMICAVTSFLLQYSIWCGGVIQYLALLSALGIREASLNCKVRWAGRQLTPSWRPRRLTWYARFSDIWAILFCSTGRVYFHFVVGYRQWALASKLPSQRNSTSSCTG